MSRENDPQTQVIIEEKYQPLPLLRDLQHLAELSEKYQIRTDDIMLIALNCSGVTSKAVGYERGRFIAKLPTGEVFLLALTVTNNPLSQFEHNGTQVLFNGIPVLEATQIEEDTCTDSYWRKGKHHLTLNSNSRSKCVGCDFCGTYSLTRDDEPLTNPESLRAKVLSLEDEIGGDLLGLESIALVTGCFPTEKALIDHLFLLRSVFAEFGFAGELSYVGSQLRDQTAIREIIAGGRFSYYLTIEAFERREQLMRRNKASLSVEKGREILNLAKSLGADTSFLYIAGLDSLEGLESGLVRFADVVTRMPNIQTFQVYQPGQIALRNPAASQLDYYLRTRKIAESIFPGLLPDAGLNFRGLWFTSCRDQRLPQPAL